MSPLLRASLEWIGCHVVVLALLGPWQDMENHLWPWMWGSAFTLFPLFYGFAQLYPLRRHVRWWAWLPAVFVGFIGSFVFLMFSWVMLGFTTSCAQALCILPRRPLAALLWVVLGSAGWLLGLQFEVFEPYVTFAMQAIILLPAVWYLEKATSKQEGH